MSSEEILRYNESQATYNNQIISHVSGKTPKNKKSSWLSLSATGLIIGMIVIVALFFGSGNLIPSAISERIIEETDVQYADAVESKKIVFQQALYNGEIPEYTANILKDYGIEVGYIEDGDFISSNKASGELVLKQGDKIITADNFVNAVSSDLTLYNAFNNATYSRAAYYFDEDAKRVFNDIGTNRNNYNDDSDFNETMSKILGEGSNIDINNASIIEEEVKNEQTGEVTTVTEYIEAGETIKSKDANNFVNKVGEKNYASSTNEATLNSADSLKAADTVTKEQRSSLFFLAFMENISKMKAGDGNDSKINDAMNYLYTTSKTEVVDINTGEIVENTGTPLDSPSLYAILSGNEINAQSVENYSSDRVLKVVQNKVNTSSSNIDNTIVSTANKTRGTIGRINSGSAVASNEILNYSKPIIDSSLINNSFETIKGVNAGEFLVEGAVNVGKRLAKTSGATAGDSNAVIAYQKVNNSIVAMDAKLDRMNRSPFDISSKNTFLGSIVWNMAITFRGSNKLISGLKSFSRLTSKSLISLLPNSYADATEGYLTNFGNCETIGGIGAVGSLQCSEIATFDTSTLNNPFSDAGFLQFVNENTTLNEFGDRVINNNSQLADFILYNNERKTPIGITDGGILDTINNKSNSKSIPLILNILEMLKNSHDSSSNNKRIASGEIFVNSSSNPDWQTYKYAQRYVSLARAAAALKYYSNNSTAYNSLKFFEGTENPVAAFLDSFYASNNNLVVTEISN